MSHIEQDHCDQGFSWRPENVTFFTAGTAGVADVEVWLEDQWRPDQRAVRSIRLPFRVVPPGQIIACDSAYHPESRGEPQPFQLPAGDYALYFETGWISDEARVAELGYGEASALGGRHRPTWVRLTFVPNAAGIEVEPAILRADEELKPPAELNMEAEPINRLYPGDASGPILPNQYR